MYNILTEKLPDHIVVEGEKCFLKTDFKRWIIFEIILTNPRLSPEQKIAAFLPICLKKLPSNIDRAVKACFEFYSCGIHSEKSGVQTQRPLYSFFYDSELIFAAFMTQYGIDLNSADMHWHKFRALFKGLQGTNKLVEVMQIRGTNLSDIKDAETRTKLRELKKIWELPDLRTESDRSKEIALAIESLC